MQNQTEPVAIATTNAPAGLNNPITPVPNITQRIRCYSILLSNNLAGTNVISLHWAGYAAAITLSLPTNVLGIPLYIVLPTGKHYDGPAGVGLQINVAGGTVDVNLMYDLIDSI